ncbi:MAG: N-formylglutamate amidohydrolase [Paracoccus sp. (in: a-proteobacteria)]|nr:N-formylglutamate amidohydrolase [Paracoccus sp. (in: a-proteobacteria)]
MIDDSSFTVTRPRVWTSGVIMCSPHSGRDYPGWFLRESILDPLALRSSEDAFMDDLARPAADAGAVLLCARMPRALVDLNRGPSEIDPAAVAVGGAAAGRRVNARTMAGLGVIPRIVGQGRAIRAHLITHDEAQRRIALWWRPYHSALRGLIAEAQSRFGHAIVLDLHSMPADAVSHMRPAAPQIVLGNRHGQSAGPEVTRHVEAAFREAGFRVRLNAPFSGAYIADAYGSPARNTHVVQVEIDRTLYLDEARIAPSENYPAFAALFAGILARLAAIRPAGALRIAAE